MSLKNKNITHKDNTIVFRLQNDKIQHGLEYTIKDWGKSKMYDDNAINAIESSNKHSLSEPTSIPSPFARIALAKTAFAEVAEHGENASAVYQKIVSDCLDVAEIFFTFDKWKDRLTIIKWDKKDNLKELEKGHFQFYKTLDTFLKTDAKEYNFDRMNCIYILKERDTEIMIGATSPCTLFFSSANDINQSIDDYNKYKKDKKDKIDYIRLSKNHIAFSDNFPLYKRSWDFQKFLYTWLEKYNNEFVDGKTIALFPDVAKYLDKQKALIGKSGKDFTNLQDVKMEEEYINLDIEILKDKHYYKQKPKQDSEITSDFIIQSTLTYYHEVEKKQIEIKPLVLPVEDKESLKNYSSWQLSDTTLWDKFIAPFEDKKSFENRYLPDGTTYPFLTISDFFTDTIIQLPYELDEKGFFNGNLNKNSKYSYLLPLTDTFFRFFTTEDLKTKQVGKQPMLELKEESNGVWACLRIPVSKRNEYVEYRRFYFNDLTPNIEHNEGGVIQSDFDFALFPNIQFDEEENAYYRFGLVTPKGSKDYFSATFYNRNENPVNVVPVLRNNRAEISEDSQTYGLNRTKIDRIAITDKDSNTSGIIIPEFSKLNGTQEFTFAVDLGTTNTHIEYTTGRTAEIKPFDIVSDVQVSCSRKDDKLDLVVSKEFIPEYIGKESKRNDKFPIRTALSVIENLDKVKEVHPFVQANIAVPYQKLEFDNAKTQLKWNTDTKQMQYFIDCLCFMLRNKVLLNKGNLAATKIVWFYPLSMLGTKSKKISEIWELAYAKYFFGINVNSYQELTKGQRDQISKQLIPLTESEAPYLFYKESRDHKQNISDLVSIDIGGGTTDVVFVENNEIKYMTSFRFAANAVFGIGDDLRKVVDKYSAEIENVIAENDKNYALGNLLKSIKGEKNKDSKNKQVATGDMASFFFSLLDNEILKEKRVASDVIDFHLMLKNDENQKLVFVLFYAAIIYHIAQIAKAAKLSMPRHLTFSGNGSRILTVISDIEVLEEFSKLIFEDVGFTKATEGKLTIIHNYTNPKEVSAKGGIQAADKNYQPSNFKSVVLLGIDNKTFAGNKTYKDVDIDSEHKTKNDVDKTIIQVKDFIGKLDSWLDKYYKGGRDEELFVNALNINVSKRNKLQELLKSSDKDFKTWTKTNGIKKRIDEMGDKSQKIEETFFFYPLTGFLQTLSSEIENSKNQ